MYAALVEKLDASSEHRLLNSWLLRAPRRCAAAAPGSRQPVTDDKIALSGGHRPTNLGQRPLDAVGAVTLAVYQRSVQIKTDCLYRHVPEAGIEPARRKAKDFKSSAFTSFATRAAP